VIRLEAVAKTFERPGQPPVRAVQAVDLEVAAGETVALIGTSGCGKSTTLRLVNRLEEPTAGRVRVAGRDVSTVPPVELRRGIGYVLQSGALFPHLSVRDNVGLLGRVCGWQRARCAARADQLLALVRLEPAEYGGRFPAELSGGEQQRVSIARALLLDPPILLMDEPFGALDPLTRAGVRAEFAATEAELGKTILLVTHDLEEAFVLADRVGVMSEGRLLQVDTPEALRRNPADPFVADFLAGQRLGA
jgi:osmoprotectant transport system ATP-binding protein